MPGTMLSITHRPSPEAGAPRLALIHSLALDRSVWDGVVRRLEGEAEILTYDCRGHGQSPRTEGPYSAQQFARDLAAIFDDIGWDAAAIAGRSRANCCALYGPSVLGDCP